MKKLIGLGVVLGVALLAVPAFAESASVGSGKPLTRIEFGDHFRGLDSKLVDRKYTEYRAGHIPAPTLDTSSMR